MCGTVASLTLSGEETSPPKALQTLLAQVSKFRGDQFGGISAEQTDLAKKIQAYRGAAVAPVLKLLQSDQEYVRDFAGYIIRDLEGVSEKDLDILIAATQNGAGWVPPAIARIGTPRAVEFLLTALKNDPQGHTQFTYALKLAGEKAVPGLVELVKVLPPADAPHFYDDPFIEILGDPDGAGAAAVPALRALVRDEHFDAGRKLRTIRILGAIGTNAAAAIDDLKAVAAANPEKFSSAVKEALTNIGAREALSGLLLDLKEGDGDAFYGIARLGPNGRDAGPAIEEYLNHESDGLRIGAARALGYLEYTEAAPALAKFVDDQDNWQLAYSAAESLGRMKAPSATSALEKAAKDHWFPPVRVAASRALRSIKGEKIYPPHRPDAGYAEMMMSYTNGGETPRARSHGPGTRRFAKEPGVLGKFQLKRLAYTPHRAEPTASALRQTPVEKVQPELGIRIGDVYLLGSDFGEFGGELGYRDAHGLTRTLIHSNVHGIHQMAFGVIVTTGLAHLGLNFGTAWLVQLKPGEPPVVQRFKVLPGAPGQSGILENGDLFIACNGGDVIITRAGEILMADPR